MSGRRRMVSVITKPGSMLKNDSGESAYSTFMTPAMRMKAALEAE